VFSFIIKIHDLLDRRSKFQFGTLFMLLLIKSFLDGIGLGLIAPYIAAITDSSIIFNHSIFKDINVYMNINTKHGLILWMSMILIALFILKNVFGLFVVYYQSKLIFTKRAYLSKALFQLYMNAPYSFHLKHNSAELDRNVRFEMPSVFSLIQNLLILFSNILLMISIFIVLFLANWQAVLVISMFIISTSSIFLFFTGRYSKMFGKEIQTSQLHVGIVLKEGIGSVIEAKLIGIESFFLDRFLKHYLTAARSLWRQATISSAPNMFFEILAVGSLIGAIIFLSNQNIDLLSVMPVVGLYSFAFIRLIPSVTAAIRSIQGIKFSTPALEVVHADFKKLAYTQTETQNYQHNNQHIKFKNISLQNISLAYIEDKNIIDGLSMEINKGEAIGITGPSGSGKTTLINLILGLFKPDSGLIYVNDEEIQTNLGYWRSLIGYVPQSITLLDASIRENVALGLEGSLIDNHKVWSVLKEANLEKFVRALPQKLDTFIGENGMRISGGQRQRLGLARALYHNPEVLVFDEATSSLDVETERRITEEIMKLSGKRTLIIVAHRTSTIKDCNVIYYIKDGKILNSGRYDELKELST